MATWPTTTPVKAGGLVPSWLHCPGEAVSRVRSHISPGPYRSFRELSLAGSVDPVIWCPPPFVGNSGIERSNGHRGFALLLCFCCPVCCRGSLWHGRHTPRKRSIQYAVASRLLHQHSVILDHPLEPVIGRRVAPTRWRVMTASDNSGNVGLFHTDISRQGNAARRRARGARCVEQRASRRGGTGHRPTRTADRNHAWRRRR